MNWYKKAQIRIKEIDINDNNHYYTDYGHDAHNANLDDSWMDEEDRISLKDMIKNNPNYIWVYTNGGIQKIPETREQNSHCDISEDYDTDSCFSGRYSSRDKIITVTPPYGIASFRDLPSFLISKLQKEFPEAKEIYLYR